MAGFFSDQSPSAVLSQVWAAADNSFDSAAARSIAPARWSHYLPVMPNAETPVLPLSLQRRSQRLLLRVPVEVHRVTATGQLSTQQTATLAVNAHGALVILKAPVSESEQLVIKNVKTGEEQACRVVYVGPTEANSTQVGVEFLRPSPQMWGVVFPPQDWNAGKTARPNPPGAPVKPGA